MSVVCGVLDLFILFGCLCALVGVLVVMTVAAPVLWLLDRRKPFKPEIPQDLWKGAPKCQRHGEGWHVEGATPVCDKCGKPVDDLRDLVLRNPIMWKPVHVDWGGHDGT